MRLVKIPTSMNARSTRWFSRPIEVASRTTVPTSWSRMCPNRYWKSGDSGVVSTERGIGISSSPMRLPDVPITPTFAPSAILRRDSTMYDTEVFPLVPVTATMSMS